MRCFINKQKWVTYAQQIDFYMKKTKSDETTGILGDSMQGFQLKLGSWLSVYLSYLTSWLLVGKKIGEFPQDSFRKWPSPEGLRWGHENWPVNSKGQLVVGPACNADEPPSFPCLLNALLLCWGRTAMWLTQPSFFKSISLTESKANCFDQPPVPSTCMGPSAWPQPHGRNIVPCVFSAPLLMPHGSPPYWIPLLLAEKKYIANRLLNSWKNGKRTWETFGRWADVGEGATGWYKQRKKIAFFNFLLADGNLLLLAKNQRKLVAHNNSQH